MAGRVPAGRRPPKPETVKYPPPAPPAPRRWNGQTPASVLQPADVDQIDQLVERVEALGARAGEAADGIADLLAEAGYEDTPPCRQCVAAAVAYEDASRLPLGQLQCPHGVRSRGALAAAASAPNR